MPSSYIYIYRDGGGPQYVYAWNAFPYMERRIVQSGVLANQKPPQDPISKTVLLGRWGKSVLYWRLDVFIKQQQERTGDGDVDVTTIHQFPIISFVRSESSGGNLICIVTLNIFSSFSAEI